ncbi:MAG: ATP-dependent sacrificial sulfur transferase LarE [Oscillospiraceae bacterium]|nr:ATP-dependent sacrificial sulfur transferase LarE [Oscillospiraceae bacterium]MCI8878325.1 ATP-dependent sacrificial sulfur transferase LarE [Oscillospiraceae bacterium]
MTIQEFFQAHPRAAVAFSGGVDSAWLLHEAARYAEKAAAYFVRTPFQPAFELDDARDTARRLGTDLTVVDFDILTVPEAAANPPDRCYYCKRALFSRLLERAAADGFGCVLDGGNASDDAADRPGMRALRELGVLSPLRLCGLAKGDIRRLAREAGLPVWDKPSYACLATRVPAGTPIARRDLERVERGEGKLMALGFADLRLRLRGEDALLQVRPEQLEQARERLPELEKLLGTDFRHIDLDPVGRVSREV